MRISARTIMYWGSGFFMKLLFLLLFSLSIFAPPARSQVGVESKSLDSTYALPEIRIHATRYSKANRFLTARNTSLDKKLIESTGGRSLDEILQRAGGVFIRQYGSGLATLSMRGGNSSHSIITIDGMPLYDPQLGQVDLSLVPDLLLENISILHGQSSSLYGANGLTGVLDIETPAYHVGSLFSSAKATIGAYGERQADISIGIRRKRVRGILSIRYGEEEGDFSYEDSSLYPVETVKRQGADQQFTSYFGKVDWFTRSSHSTFTAWVNRFERGLPGPITLQFRDERQWDTLHRFNLQHVRKVFVGTLSIRTGFQGMSLRYANPFLEVDDTGKTQSFLLDARYNLRKSRNSIITLGVDNAYRVATHPSISKEANEVQTSAYVLGEFQVDALVVIPSARWDRYRLPEGKTLMAISPNVGVNIHLPPVPQLFLKAQAGRSFKTPTFNDRFWQPGGNADLKPEISWGYEAGLLWDALSEKSYKGWSSEVTVYRQHVQDQISWIPTDLGYWSPFNIRGVLVSGLESSLRIHTSFWRDSESRLELLYHFTETRNQSEPGSSSYNQPLRYSPGHLFKVGHGTETHVGNWSIGYDVFSRYVSKRFVTEDGSASLPAYWTSDVRLGTRLRTEKATVSLHFLMENVLDRDYEIIKGYLMPPRLLRIELGIQWPGTPESTNQ